MHCSANAPLLAVARPSCWDLILLGVDRQCPTIRANLVLNGPLPQTMFAMPKTTRVGRVDPPPVTTE